MTRRCPLLLAAILLTYQAHRHRNRPLVEVAGRLRTRSRALLGRGAAGPNQVAQARAAAARATSLLARLGIRGHDPLSGTLVQWALLEPSSGAVLHLGVRRPPAAWPQVDRLEEQIWITVAGDIVECGSAGFTSQDCRELWSSEPE